MFRATVVLDRVDYALEIASELTSHYNDIMSPHEYHIKLGILYGAVIWCWELKKPRLNWFKSQSSSWGPKSWLSQEKTVIRLQSFNYEFHDDGWCWWEAHDSWQISKTADEVVYGRNCFCSALFYLGLEAPRAKDSELIQNIHESIHENGNRQRKPNRAAWLLFCWGRNRFW